MSDEVKKLQDELREMDKVVAGLQFSYKHIEDAVVKIADSMDSVALIQKDVDDCKIYKNKAVDRIDERIDIKLGSTEFDEKIDARTEKSIKSYLETDTARKELSKTMNGNIKTYLGLDENQIYVAAFVKDKLTLRFIGWIVGTGAIVGTIIKVISDMMAVGG